MKNRSERSRRYYLKHKKKIRAKQKLYYLKNKEKSLKRGKKWFLLNKDKHHKSVQKWYLKNKTKVKERLKLYFESNLNAKLTRNLRTRLYYLIKSSPTSLEINDLIGCTYLDLIKYLESKFQPGMTWENYGKTGWHIDHIKPCSSFDLKSEANQKACFHYTNLQPLWALDNLRKNNKEDYVI